MRSVSCGLVFVDLGLGIVDLGASGLEDVEADVATADCPLAVLLGEHGADESVEVPAASLYPETGRLGRRSSALTSTAARTPARRRRPGRAPRGRTLRSMRADRWRSPP